MDTINSYVLNSDAESGSNNDKISSIVFALSLEKI